MQEAYTKLIMPEHDVTFTPVWAKEVNAIYDAGTDDRIVGNRSYVFTKLEGTDFELAANDRLVRQGFKLTGWTCEVDNQVYKPLSDFTMPDKDIVFTAVWEPITYTVVFKVNNGTSELIRIKGETDTAIIAPECEFTKEGYTFAGWSFEGHDELYQPGDEFIIPGALPGLGIMLTGVWVEESSEEEEVVDVFAFVKARQDYADGKITKEELKAMSDTLLRR